MNKRGQAETKNLFNDYSSYRMSASEKLLCIICASAVIYPAAYIFYRSHIVSCILLTLSLLYPGVKCKRTIEKRQKELNLQFRDMLYSLSSSLSAGRPVERAFESVRQDLALQYPDRAEMINIEIGLIISRLDINVPIEVILADFAERSHLEDIKNFADVFRIAKRAGGNLVEVVRNTSNIINDKHEIYQEIETVLSERRLERRLLTVLPVGLVLLLSATASDYMLPIFTTISGRFVMTVAVLLMLAANLISMKLLNIKV